MIRIAALLSLLAFGANAATLVDTSSALTRTATVTSATSTFFKLDPTREAVVEVSGTGTATLKVTTAYDATPTTYAGFIPDPDGSVSSATGWRLPKGLSYLGLDTSSGTWNMRVAQPQ